MTQEPCVHLMDEITDEAAGILEMVPNYSRIEGVEVGTLRGKTASILLLRRPGLFLHMVDPFWTEGIVKDPPGDVRAAAYRNTLFAESRRAIHEVPSPGAALDGRFLKESMDFVFVDAAHHYEAVRDDLAAWWPIVRHGGVLCGHDYGRARPPATLPGTPDWGVEQAVTEFISERGLKLFHCDLKRTTWGVVKP